METAVVLVILSWILKYKVNRWVTIIIGALIFFSATNEQLSVA